MRCYEGSAMIASSPDAVRAGLTDGAAWPRPDLGPSSGWIVLGLKRRVETGR